MDAQSEMLLPFESMGVDTTWELQLPKVANPFDYRTIADVLFTIECTALHSADYREQVIRRLDRRVDADLPFSLRDQFPDQWYELSNPDQSATPLTLRFTTTPDDFPASVEDVRIAHVLLHFAGVAGEAAKIEVSHLHFVPKAGKPDQPLGGSATADENGVISTRRGNGANWASQLTGAPPIGTWELKLAASTRPLLAEAKINDILLVITYSGRLPAWPT
jgi:hypothetical protein